MKSMPSLESRPWMRARACSRASVDAMRIISVAVLEVSSHIVRPVAISTIVHPRLHTSAAIHCRPVTVPFTTSGAIHIIVPCSLGDAVGSAAGIVPSPTS